MSGKGFIGAVLRAERHGCGVRMEVFRLAMDGRDDASKAALLSPRVFSASRAARSQSLRSILP